MVAELRVKMGEGVWSGIGLPDRGDSVFILRETMPTPFNSGVPFGTVLTPWDADIVTPRTITITVPGTLIEDVDFGNIRVDIRAAGVILRRCRWIVTNNRTTTPMVRADQAPVGGAARLEYCTIENRDQLGYQFNAVQGHDITVSRCCITGTVDGVRPNLGGNVTVEGSFIGYLGWWGTEVGKPTLNSGDQTHSDGIQTTYAGVQIIGNSLWGYPSTTVGTGTPGSGSESTPGAWYTEAQGVARRAVLNGGKFTNAAQSADGVSHEIGLQTTPLMCNVATGPTALALVLEDNWIAGGGAVQVNALATNLTAPLFASAKRNKHFNDSGSKQGGNAIGYRVRTDLDTALQTSGRLPSSGPDRNTFVDNGATVPVSRP